MFDMHSVSYNNNISTHWMQAFIKEEQNNEPITSNYQVAVYGNFPVGPLRDGKNFREAAEEKEDLGDNRFYDVTCNRVKEEEKLNLDTCKVQTFDKNTKAASDFELINTCTIDKNFKDADCEKEIFHMQEEINLCKLFCMPANLGSVQQALYPTDVSKYLKVVDSSKLEEISKPTNSIPSILAKGEEVSLGSTCAAHSDPNKVIDFAIGPQMCFFMDLDQHAEVKNCLSFATLIAIKPRTNGSKCTKQQWMTISS